MPKIIDHDKQRASLIEATLRLIQRYGVERLSVRLIAGEAKMSVGAMRHYIGSQDDLYLFLYDIFQGRVALRIQSQKHEGDALTQLQGILEQLLPLDEERYIEATFWLSFTIRAYENPKLQQKLTELHRDIRSYVQAVVDVLAHIAPQNNLNETDTTVLMALIDGLTISHLQNPTRVSAEQMRVALRHHLCKLSCQETGSEDCNN